MCVFSKSVCWLGTRTCSILRYAEAQAAGRHAQQKWPSSVTRMRRCFLPASSSSSSQSAVWYIWQSARSDLKVKQSEKMTHCSWCSSSHTLDQIPVSVFGLAMRILHYDQHTGLFSVPEANKHVSFKCKRMPHVVLAWKKAAWLYSLSN